MSINAEWTNADALDFRPYTAYESAAVTYSTATTAPAKTISLVRRYPDSKTEDITDAYNRGVLYGMAMGRGTCKWCTSGTFDGQTVMMSNHGWQTINYCPNCGRRVVAGDGE